MSSRQPFMSSLAEACVRMGSINDGLVDRIKRPALFFSSRATLNKFFFIFAKSTTMNWKPFRTLIYLSGKERIAGTRCD